MQRMLSTKKKKISPQETQPNQANYLASSISKAPGFTTSLMEDIRRHKDKFLEVASMAKVPVGLLMAVVRSISTYKLEAIPHLLQVILVNTSLNPQLTAVGNDFYFNNGSDVSIMSNTWEIE